MDVKEREVGVEALLPKGYPQLLIHGCDIPNGRSITKVGMLGGMFSTSLVNNFDTRFFRPGESCLVVAPFDQTKFETVEHNPFIYYRVKKGHVYNGNPVHVSAPDYHIAANVNIISESDNYLPPADILGAMVPNTEQYDYIQDVLWLTRAEFPGLELSIWKTEAIFRLFGVDGIRKHSNLQSYINSRYENETDFFRALAKKFPEPLVWLSGTHTIAASEEVLYQMFLQSYQAEIARATSIVLAGDEYQQEFIRFSQNPSAENFKSISVSQQVPSVVVD